MPYKYLIPSSKLPAYVKVIYAYNITVMYVTYFQIYYYYLLDRVCMLALYEFAHYHATAKSNKLPLNNRGTPITVFYHIIRIL